MRNTAEAVLVQPFLASDVIAAMFCLFALVYGLLWWRERDLGIGWFACSWLTFGLWFGSTPYQPLASPFIVWSPWWLVGFLSFVTLTLGLVDYVEVALRWRRTVILFACAPLVFYLLTYQLPLLGWPIRRSFVNLWVVAWYGMLGALAWWAGGRERGAGHRVVAVTLWAVPLLSVGLALAQVDAPVLRYYAVAPVLLLALTLLTATLLRRRHALNEEALRRGAAEDELRKLNVQLEERLQERERALAEAEAGRDRFSRVFQSAATVSSISEVTDGTILDINEAGCRRYGIRREQILGRTLASLGVGMPAVSRAALIERLERDGRVSNMEIAFHVGEGPPPTLLVSAEYIEWEGRRRLLLMGNDITERRQAEQALLDLNANLETRVAERTRELQAALEHLQEAQDELVRSEKMASLGALVAGVAHELNTPIGNAVLVASTLHGRQREFEAAVDGGLRRSALDAFLADLREGSAVVERNLQRAAELIGSFKQIAVDQSSYQRREFDLAEVVQEIALSISPTLKHSGVRLLEQVPLGLRMDSHPGPLGQVLINLVNNAATHAFDEGASGSVRIAAEGAGHARIRLTVSDNGRGIPQHNLKRIFDPFFTTRLGQGGTGLGLHIAYTLVTGLLGGRIEVSSMPGQGTAFAIELPCVAPNGVVESNRRPL